MTKLLSLIVIAAHLLLTHQYRNASESCNSRSFGDGRYVCVCNATFCDFHEHPSPPETGAYHIISTSRTSPGYSTLLSQPLDEKSEGTTILEVNYDAEFQKIIGFGGGFTDSTGLNILSLSEPVQNYLLRSYFSPEGAAYSVGRLPISGNDFSPRPYSYAEVNEDKKLEYFSLTEEDYKYKIPIIERAQSFASEDILLLASSWSPPSWMKTNKQLSGSGRLIKEYYQLYSDYVIKFLESYAKSGISVWGITTQNEPTGGLPLSEIMGKEISETLNRNSSVDWNQCAFSAEELRDWIKCCLGPTVRSSSFSEIKIITHDSPRHSVQYYLNVLYEDEDVVQYLDGVSTHFYADHKISGNIMSHFYRMKPQMIWIQAEACEGVNKPTGENVVLGSWPRAESYASSILDNLNNFAQIWLDWNMALDQSGGPGWANNRVDSPIIINAEMSEFYKQPMYYVMGHFSRHVERGAIRLESRSRNSNIDIGAFRNVKQETVTIIILNKSENEENVTFNTPQQFINIRIQAKSLTTIITNWIPPTKSVKNEL